MLFMIAEVTRTNKVIAVEDNLSPVKDFLSSQGCQIISVQAAMQQNVDAVVLSGSDENLMGIEDVVINAPVISARGRTPDEIWQSIQQHSK